jgi:alpha-ketoglutarate-dependent taurine dioxygenase
MSDVHFSPLTPTFGVEAHGIDLSASMAPDVMRQLATAYIEHKVLLLRGRVRHSKPTHALRVIGATLETMRSRTSTSVDFPTYRASVTPVDCSSTKPTATVHVSGTPPARPKKTPMQRPCSTVFTLPQPAVKHILRTCRQRRPLGANRDDG